MFGSLSLCVCVVYPGTYLPKYKGYHHTLAHLQYLGCKHQGLISLSAWTKHTSRLQLGGIDLSLSSAESNQSLTDPVISHHPPTQPTTTTLVIFANLVILASLMFRA